MNKTWKFHQNWRTRKCNLYPSEQFFIVCECFSHYFCWNRTLIGPKRLSHRHGKSANRSDLSIKTTKNIKFCIIISALRKKYIFTTLVFIWPFPYVFRRFLRTESRQCLEWTSPMLVMDADFWTRCLWTISGNNASLAFMMRSGILRGYCVSSFAKIFW
jgi:hypothetical protein